MNIRLVAAAMTATIAVGALPVAGAATPAGPTTVPATVAAAVAQEQPRDQPWHYGHSSRGAFLAGWSGEHLISPTGTTQYRRKGPAAATGMWRVCGDTMVTASLSGDHGEDHVTWRNLATGGTGTTSTDWGTNYLGPAPGGILFAQQTPSALDRTSDIVLRAPDGSRRILATIDGFIGGGSALCDTSGIAILMQVAARGDTPAQEVLSFVRFSGGAVTLSTRTASATSPTRLVEVNGTSVLWTVGSALETPVTLYRSDVGSAAKTIVTVPTGQEVLGAGASATETMYSVRKDLDVTTTSLSSDGTRVVIPGGPQGYTTWWQVGSSWRAAGQDGMWTLTGSTAIRTWQPPFIMDVARIAGRNRYETATAIQSGLPSPDTVYIASGANFPDALSGAPAAVRVGGSLLLTPPTSLDPSVGTYLTSATPSEVVILGGTGAVSSAVESALRAYAPTVRRVSGADRYATAAAVSRDRFPAGAGGTVVLASGEAFPDALAAGPAAAQWGGPLLLTTAAALPAATAAELARLRPDRVVVVGGTSVVSTGVATALKAYAATVERASGPDRYSTAATLSAKAFPSGAPSAYIVTGENFPDGLAAGAVVGRRGGPLLLTPRASLPAVTTAELTRLEPVTGVVVGGETVVSDNAYWGVQHVTWP